MEDGRTPKDLLYGEQETGQGRDQPDAHNCGTRTPASATSKRCMGINTVTWEATAADRSTWKQEVHITGVSLASKRTRRSRQKRKGHAG